MIDDIPEETETGYMMRPCNIIVVLVPIVCVGIEFQRKSAKGSLMCTFMDLEVVGSHGYCTEMVDVKFCNGTGGKEASPGLVGITCWE